MLFYKRSTWWKHLRVIGLVPVDVACWVIGEEGIKTPYSTGSSFYFLLSVAFATFLNHWPLSSAASSISWCWSCFLYSGLTYEIYSGNGAPVYIYCMICYRVVVAPYVKGVAWSVQAITLLMTDSECSMDYYSIFIWSMDYELSSPPKLFFLNTCNCLFLQVPCFSGIVW